MAGARRSLGLTTGLLDPAPQRPWMATYGMWSRELPADLPPSVVAARAAGRAIAVTEHDLGWEYAVLDVPALHFHLSDRLTGVDVRVDRAVGSPGARRGCVGRWTYLTARDDVGGTASAMGCLFRVSNWGLRRHLVASAVRRPLKTNDVT